MTHPFEGIYEKLKRADQNILNLQAEINIFTQEGEYPVLRQDDKEILLKAIAYHKKRLIPSRFSVLAGEIVHHLRSCLDHVAWHFSSAQYRTDHFWLIEFPNVERRPADKKEIARYEGKIKGIANPTVRRLIEEIQPYNAKDRIDSALLIVHNLDIVDKHRELVLCASTGSFQAPWSLELFQRYVLYKSGKPGIPPVDLTEIAREMKKNVKVVPQVSFRNFGKRPIQPIIPGLIDLANVIRTVVNRFADEI